MRQLIEGYKASLHQIAADVKFARKDFTVEVSLTNLISYQDWCQTWGFTTFRYLKPPQLMVWKSDFFRESLRFVRVPPYESWANWTNFFSSWENGDFFWGQNCCTLIHTQNEEKSQKISTCIRIHTRLYTNKWWWGQICPPPSRIGLNIARGTRDPEIDTVTCINCTSTCLGLPNWHYY